MKLNCWLGLNWLNKHSLFSKDLSEEEDNSKAKDDDNKKGHNSWSVSFSLFNVILFNPFIFVSLIYASEMGGYVLFMPDAHFYERAHISAKRRYKWPPSIATVGKYYFIFYWDLKYKEHIKLVLKLFFQSL